MSEPRDTPQPLATRPELRAFVAAAREQPIVGTAVTSDRVLQTWQLRRRRRRTGLAIAGSFAAAAALLLAFAIPAMSETSSSELASDESSSDRVEHHDAEASTAAEPADTKLAAQQRLASAVRIQSSAAVEVRGPWSIALSEGNYELEVDAQEGHHLQITIDDRNLELLHGHASVDVNEDGVAAVRLHTGVAAWVDEDGTRSQISVEHSELLREPDTTPSKPSAAALARRAESLLADGRRDEAIASLEQLVRQYPKASHSRTALLDLGRLLRNAGEKDRARCAYDLYLQRWPDSSLQAEVQTQLDALGAGPSCSGLTPGR